MKSKLASYVRERLLDSSECMGQDVDHSSSFSIDRRSQLMMDKDGWKEEEEEKEYEKQGKENKRNPRNLLKLALVKSYNVS